ncbi:MAG: hypothetical protein HZA90_20770 [Verrucomicrobia bacterium]|nr:hypothetical protein [Verrucomicrobiota bacterium]
MFAKPSKLIFRRRPRVAATAALSVLLLWGAARPAGAAAITNVTVVNVTPSSFSVIWRAVDSLPSIAVFADAGGVTNLAGRVGVEVFPHNTGNPDLTAGYERRQGQIALRQKTRTLGFAMVRVTGCRPNTTYYYRLTSTTSGGSAANYPLSGPLPSVTTERENTFVVSAQQLIIDVPGVDVEGRVVTLTHPNASHSLAAVVGDGVGTNQVFFNLNDLFALVSGGNFTPIGPQDFAVNVWGPNQADAAQQFSLVFNNSFTVAQPTVASMGTEFVAFTIGSTIVRAGQTSSVPITYSSSAGIVDLTINLDMPAGHLTNLALTALSPEVDPATATVTALGGNSFRFHLAARAGQFMLGSKTIAQFAFRAVSNQPSAFVPMTLRTITATKSGGAALNNLYANAGRIVVVANEPLLEAELADGGNRRMTLYGKPWMSYAIERSSDLGNPNGWTHVRHFPLTSMMVVVDHVAPNDRTGFYRAVEFQPDPPVIDPPDPSRSALVYGRTNLQYTLVSSPTLSGVLTWTPVLNYTLTNSFRYLTLPAPTNTLFYRVQRN